MASVSIAQVLARYWPIVLGGLIGLALYWLYRSRQGLPSASHPKGGQVARLHRELHSLMRGDRTSITRTIETLRYRYPEKSEEWLYEKAIFDIKRDRRSG